MQMTAVVINAGLGDLSLGLKMAGFQVIAAYETDIKAMAVQRTNLDVPLFPFPLEENDIKAVPDVDLLAAKLHQSWLPDHRYSLTKDFKAADDNFLMFLDAYRPRCFFLTLNMAFAKSKRMQIFLEKVGERKYQYKYQIFDTAQVTGTPVAEHMAFMIGSRLDVKTDFEFLEGRDFSQALTEGFLQLEQTVDPWYFNIKIDDIPVRRNGKPFYCWINGSYIGMDLIRWNYQKVPLVDTGESFRKITHREIANLKGFPTSYTLPDHTNKTWLYQKLMYSTNVWVIKQIADKLAHSLANRSWWGQGTIREARFEDLFDRYLKRLVHNTHKRNFVLEKNICSDFMLQINNQTLYFELKCYSGRYASLSRIRTICKQLSPLRKSGQPVLVLTYEISESIKSRCWKDFQVFIWDVRNLLWLFSEFEDIKNEFIALLDYAVGDIEPLPPDPNIVQKIRGEDREDSEGTETEATVPEMGVASMPGAVPEAASTEWEETLSWKERLARIAPGQEQFKDYELLCIEILKYILGDYLTLWEIQEQTDDGLYRFDLCCKIKNGVHQDFFDTIKSYFKTKYIVFEFKNYTDKIGQKEIYTTEKYLYETALRKVAVILSRKGMDAHALKAIKGSLRESGKLILCLSDQDLLKMVDIKAQGEGEPAEFLDELLDGLLIHLEK